MTASTERVWYAAVLTLVALVLLAWMRLGTRRYRHPAWWPHLLSAFVAVIGVALPSFSQFDNLCDHSFAAHMVEHGLFLYVVPISVLSARPIALAFQGLRLLPRSANRLVTRGLKLFFAAMTPFAVLGSPVSALMLSSVCLWFWHLPSIYNFALLHRSAHIAEHLSFLVTSLLYWRPLVGQGNDGAALNSNASRTLYLILGSMQGGLLGALIALSSHVDYTAYLSQSLSSPAKVLADQRVGGAIMWFSGPLFYGTAAALVMR